MYTSNPHQNVGHPVQIFFLGMLNAVVASGVISLAASIGRMVWEKSHQDVMTDFTVATTAYAILMFRQYRRVFVLKRGPTFVTFGLEGSTNEVSDGFLAWAAEKGLTERKMELHFGLFAFMPPACFLIGFLAR